LKEEIAEVDRLGSFTGGDRSLLRYVGIPDFGLFGIW